MFSKQVIVDIVKTFPGYHNQLEMYLIKFDLDDKISFNIGDSIETKKLAIIKYLIANQDIKDSFQNLILVNVVEDRIVFLLDDVYNSDSMKEKKNSNLFQLYINILGMMDLI